MAATMSAPWVAVGVPVVSGVPHHSSQQVWSAAPSAQAFTYRAAAGCAAPVGLRRAVGGVLAAQSSLSSTPGRPAGQVAGHLAAVSSQVVAASPGSFFANGLSREGVSENLQTTVHGTCSEGRMQNGFNNGRRRSISPAEPPQVSPRPRHVVLPPQTSLLPQALPADVDIKPASTEGWAPGEGKKHVRDPSQRAPNPMELGLEIGSRKRIAHSTPQGDESFKATVGGGASSTGGGRGEPFQIWSPRTNGANTPAALGASNGLAKGGASGAASVGFSRGISDASSIGEDFGFRRSVSLQLRPAGISSVPSPRSPRRGQLSENGFHRDEPPPDVRVRALSNDAVHRRSLGIYACLDSSFSDSDAAMTQRDKFLINAPRQRRPSQQRSLGVGRALLLEQSAAALDREKSNGEALEDAKEAGEYQKPTYKKHVKGLFDGGGAEVDGGGDLDNGFNRRPTDECLRTALGTKQKGRKNDGAIFRDTGGPGPWDALPDGCKPLRDHWGKLSPRLISDVASEATIEPPFATENNALPNPPPSARSRRSSAPELLPYGSESDVPAPSRAPPADSVPLGLTMPPPSALALGHYDVGRREGRLAVSGMPCGGDRDRQIGQQAIQDNSVSALDRSMEASLALGGRVSAAASPRYLAEFADAAAAAAAAVSSRSMLAGGAMSPQLALSAAERAEKQLTLSAGMRTTRPRARSQGPDRPSGEPLMSSTFVERQRQTTPLRGGSQRLASGAGHAVGHVARGSTSPIKGIGFGSSSARESMFPSLQAPTSASSAQLRSMRSRALGSRGESVNSAHSANSAGSSFLLLEAGDGALDEAFQKRLSSLKEECTKLQVKSQNTERQIRRVQIEQLQLTHRTPTPGNTPSFTPAFTPEMSPMVPSPAFTPRVPVDSFGFAAPAAAPAAAGEPREQ